MTGMSSHSAPNTHSTRIGGYAHASWERTRYLSVIFCTGALLLSVSFALIALSALSSLNEPLAGRDETKSASAEGRISSQDGLKRDISFNALVSQKVAQKQHKPTASHRNTTLGKDSSIRSLWRSVWSWANTTLLARQKTSKGTDRGESDTKGTDLKIPRHAVMVGPRRKWFYREKVLGVDVVYSKRRTADTKGIALLFHGCGQTADDWFQLPEHMEVVRCLQDQDIDVLAMSAENPLTKCWSIRYPATQNADANRVIGAAHQWYSDRYASSSIPLYAVGVSSGGTFATILSSAENPLGIASQVVYISPGSMRAFRAASMDYPNTLFVHSRSDHKFATPRAIRDARRTLLRQGVSFVGVLPLGRARMHPLTIHLRDSRFSESQSRHIHHLLTSAADHGIAFEDALRDATKDDEQVMRIMEHPHASRALAQIVRVLEDRHELSSTHAEKVVLWLIAHESLKSEKRGNTHPIQQSSAGASEESRSDGDSRALKDSS